MIKIINENEKVSAHFKVRELKCKDGTINVNVITVCREKLEPLRVLAGVPFVPTSSYRSLSYNRTLKDSSDSSQHILGTAFDIVWSSALKKKFGTQEKFRDFCVENGVKGFGFYKTFCHIDWREKYDEKRGWSEWDFRG